MFRWLLIIPTLALLGVLPVLQQDKTDTNRDKKPEAKKQDGKEKTRPLVDIDAFLREYHRDKDGSLSKEEMPDWLHYNFARLDGNKDGKISKDELQKGMAYLSQRRRPSDVVFVLVEMSDCDECCIEEVQRAYQFLVKLDKNKDGKIDDDELKAGRSQIIKERIGGIMKRLDANKDGKISKDEARGLVKENFAALDVNKDGFIDSSELQAGAAAKPSDAKEKKDSTREK
jgi:Ca2+-binding EF-hand superfamily protein